MAKKRFVSPSHRRFKQIVACAHDPVVQATGKKFEDIKHFRWLIPRLSLHCVGRGRYELRTLDFGIIAFASRPLSQRKTKFIVVCNDTWFYLKPNFEANTVESAKKMPYAEARRVLSDFARRFKNDTFAMWPEDCYSGGA